MKIFKFVLSALITLAVGIALNIKIGSIPPMGKFFSPFHGFWQNAENEKIDLPPIQSISGLKGEVNVHFDEQLFPHVFASNEHDLFFSQGYITAFHRLWQMEFQLFSAAGRLSEVLGPQLGDASIIEVDKGMRRIGLAYGAKNSEEVFKNEEPEVYALIEAYTEGVNAYIDQLSYKDLPIEYKLLDYSPEPWTPLKCFLLISNMSNMLSRGEMDLEHTNALKLWGREVFETLYPERPEKVDPVIPDDTSFDFDPISVSRPDLTFPLDFTNPTLEKPNPDNGSNSFVVNGEKTANGRVILTNEPDLSLNLPSIWYVMHLSAPGINVMGATLPGGPGVIIGFNDSIAWGNTNAKRDLVDWYKITFQDETRDEYLYNNNWVPTKKEIQEIKVKGGDTVYDTIIYTHHGPVVYDRNFGKERSEETNIAMKWTLHEGSKEIKALYLGNKASNYDEFVDAFRFFSGPPQNYSFASVSGNIALWVHGKFPVKWEEQGKFLMDGSDIRQEWKTYMPQNHHLHVKNPPQNFVSSANQHAADTIYPYYQYDYNYEYYRGRRINDRLRVMEDIKVKDMMALQHDNFNYNASEILPIMLDSLDSASLSPAQLAYVETLAAWDFFNDPELEAPSIYETWWKKVNDLLWDEIDSSQVKVYRPNWYTTSDILKNNPFFPMVDNQSTPEKETVKDLIRQAFDQATDLLIKYEEENLSLEWYQFKNTTIQHILRLAPFTVDQVKIGGNKSIVNAASKRHGPSWRMVVELGDGEVNAWGVYPGSQTGNPGNPMYAHMIEDWADGTYYKLLFDLEISANTESIIHSTQLKPE